MSSFAQYFLPGPSAGSSAGVGTPKLRARRWIDAAKLDYVVENGGLKQDDGFTSKALLALSTRLGSCQVNPLFGSRLYQVKRADETGRRLAEAYALLALQHLKAEIQDLTVVASLPHNAKGRIELVVSGRRGTQAVSAKYTVRR
jgi:phage gp46-like protein